MTPLLRQNALFGTEDWRRVYEALRNVDFRAADQDTLRQAMLDAIQNTYPEEFNDWIGSSEFVIRLDVILWLSQNVFYREDLNARENFILLAERRESLLNLAQNISYAVSRVRCASGDVKIDTVQTNQVLYDSDGNQIQDVVYWNNQSDPDWQDKWNVVMNAALNSRNQVGRPVKKWTGNSSAISAYRLNSRAPGSGAYPFTSNVSGTSVDFEVINADLNTQDGTYSELAPNYTNAFALMYKTDGLGASSAGTGWFMNVKQGRREYHDFSLTVPVPARVIDIDSPNINETDVWVVEVDAQGNMLSEWTRAETAYGDGVSFNVSENAQIFEVVTREDDKISIKFGDGKLGKIPVGRFRVWVRTSLPSPRTVRASDIRSNTLVVPYVSGNQTFSLTMTFSLTADMTNGSPGETNVDIKARANKVFYTQNRMVTGEDYNSFFLRDNSILKLKTVNRTYSGHGTSAPLNDPSGTYNNVKLLAEDGRIYLTEDRNKQTVTADVTVLPARAIIDDYLQPVLRTAGKFNAYYNAYGEIRVTDDIVFTVDSVVGGASRGRLQKSDGVNLNNAAVGQYAGPTDPMRYVGTEALLRFGSAEGPLARVDYVVGDGTAENGVLMKKSVAGGSQVYSVFPALRYALSGSEIDAMVARLTARKSFGVRWDQPSAGWSIVEPGDVDPASEFSLEHAGDASKGGLDASWLARVSYAPQKDGADVWVIEDRNQHVYFESDREVRFYYASRSGVYDVETGQLLRDNIKVLRDNQTRDSEMRIEGQAEADELGSSATYVDSVNVELISNIDGSTPQNTVTNVLPGDNSAMTVQNINVPGGAFSPRSAQYLGTDVMWWIGDSLRDSDGYTNPNGLELSNVDLLTTGEADDPFQFREFVVMDGVTDLVIWRLVEQDGVDVWEALSDQTVPHGTHDDMVYRYRAGDRFDTGLVPAGSVHWDAEHGEWLLADGDTLAWVVAPDQDLYRKQVGRGGIRFIWAHYTSESERIDPSPSNIHDAFVLTSGYDSAVRDWIQLGAAEADRPSQDTPDSLKVQYGSMEEYKMLSDAVVWRPASYKLLFGPGSAPELTAQIVIVKIPGASIPDNDLKLQVLQVIDNYFAVQNWEFGDSFYYSELASYIHVILSTLVQAVALVPTGPNQKLGRMFQVRSEPDELFISSANQDSIVIADSLSDTVLGIA